LREDSVDVPFALFADAHRHAGGLAVSGELSLIAWLRQQLAAHPPTASLPLGPGDDCALVDGYLFAADMLLDGVHFDLKRASAELVGRKSLAVNLSDLAAMAATPVAAVVSLALPRLGGEALGRGVMQGILDLAAEHDVAIAGGDTNSWSGPLVVSVAVTGRPHAQGVVRRSGARPGDWICVTGALGGSLAGHHLRFAPRLAEARLLHERFGLHAMLDLSDGLATDLRHILAESQVGAVLDHAAIPIAPAAGGSVERALTDGEDFELCFTLAPEAGQRLVAEQPFAGAPRVTRIGTVTATAGELRWSNGVEISLRGYEH
jgi:thiamine-monophosphate kinase